MQRPWNLTILLLACSAAVSAQPPVRPGLPSAVSSVAISGDGKLCRIDEGVGDSPHWLVTTADGRFDGPPEAWKEVSYRVLATGALRDDDATRRTFHPPGLLAKILEGKN
jgi:hypothetical protein